MPSTEGQTPEKEPGVGRRAGWRVGAGTPLPPEGTCWSFLPHAVWPCDPGGTGGSCWEAAPCDSSSCATSHKLATFPGPCAAASRETLTNTVSAIWAAS